MAEDHKDTLIQELDYLVSSVGKHFTNVRRAFRDFDVTGPEYFLLRLLSVEGTQSVSEIAGQLSLTQATASNVINAAQEKGLVAKARDASDGRVVHIGITDRGRALLEDVNAARLRRSKRVLRQLSEEELCALIRIFSKIKRAVLESEYPEGAK